jgi:hypothetical protein
MPAAMPYWTKISIRRASFGGIQSVAVKFLTSPATRHANALASKRVIGPIPLLPASAFPQASETVLPIGEMAPKPVTTTLRCDTERSEKTCGEKDKPFGDCEKLTPATAKEPGNDCDCD